MNVRGNLKEAFAELDTALKKTTGQLDATGKAATATGDALKKQNQTSIMDTANALNNAAYAGFNLYNAFDNIMDMQVSVMRSQLTLKASLNSVEDAQRRYNAALATGDPEKAAIALADLNIATERASVATERAEMIQGNYNETIVRSALTIIPTLTMGFKSLKEVIGGLGGSLSSAGSALSSFATGPVGLAIIGIAAIGTAIYLLIDNFNAMNEATRKFDAAVKSGNDALSTFNDMMGRSSTSASGWKTVIDLDNQAITMLTESLKLQEVEIEKYTTGMNGAVLGTQQ
jgi:hypothetical protein